MGQPNDHALRHGPLLAVAWSASLSRPSRRRRAGPTLRYSLRPFGRLGSVVATIEFDLVGQHAPFMLDLNVRFVDEARCPKPVADDFIRWLIY
jgi:hypothetical protein